MATSSQSDNDTKFPARFGKYILLDRINTGGMAEVFRAKVTGVEEFQRLIAIKCMLPALHQDEQFVTMFIDEAKLSSQLSHANIVQIYELGSIDEQLYIAMELISGRDLRHIIKLAKHKGLTIPIGFAAYVVARAAEGLDFAHHKTGVGGEPLNLVHRDISPQNILMSYDGEVKVVDFGIAKAEERATETRAGVLKGKFAYMAPEQVAGHGVDARTDLFALGCVLYEVLTTKKLFTGQSDLSLLEKVRNARVPDFRAEMPDMPEDLYETLVRTLAKDPAARFARGNDLAEALEPLLIDGRKIFGAKRAREFMHELYADEIAELMERSKRYAAITLADCENSDAPESHNKTQIFESSFGASGTVPLKREAGKVREERPRMPTGDGALNAAPLEAESTGGGPRMPTGEGDLKETSPPRMPRGDGGMSTAPAEPPRMPTGEGGFSGRPTDTNLNERDLTAQTEGFFQPGASGDSTEEQMPKLPPTTLGMEQLPAAAPAAKPTVTSDEALVVPKPVVYASIIAAAVMFVLVILLAIIPIDGSGTTAPNPVVLHEVTEVPTTGPKPIVITPTPNEAPAPAPAPVVEDDAGEGDESLLDDEQVYGDTGGKKGKGKRRFGFLVVVRPAGVKGAKLFINDKEVPKWPKGAMRVPLGKNVVRVVELVDGKDGRTKTLSVGVTIKHTKKAPMRLVVPL